MAGGAGEPDEVEALELAAGVGPGRFSLVLAEADEQQREPADQDVTRMRSARRWKTGRRRRMPLRSRKERSASSKFL
jgi:hypothetical protein